MKIQFQFKKSFIVYPHTTQGIYRNNIKFIVKIFFLCKIIKQQNKKQDRFELSFTKTKFCI